MAEYTDAEKKEFLDVIRSAVEFEESTALGLDSTIADAGFDSLDVLSIVDALEEHYDVVIEVHNLPEDGTIRDLVAAVKRENG